MTLSEFQKHPTHPRELEEFLASPCGRALADVLAAEHPIRKIADPSVSNKADSKKLDSIAATQAAPALLGQLQGYQLALELIDRCKLRVQGNPFAQKRREREPGLANSTID